MGNCFQKPVNNLLSTNTPTPAVVGNDDKKEEPVIGNCPPAMKTETMTPNLKTFTFAELRRATKNFRPDTVLGEGGFGTVYKGWVDGETYAPLKVGVGIVVAVKRSNSDRVQNLKGWQAKVNLLDKFNHPNLVKLLGYCWEGKDFLLVYEYMQKGSLGNHLFGRRTEPLSWNIRIKIATEAAQGLVFLHSTGIITVYKNFKCSDILLDEDFNLKLSDFGYVNLRPGDEESCESTGIFMDYDFGQANLGPANGYASTFVTYYYASSEHIDTDHLYVKNNVYNFGVVLLEMIIGLRAVGTNRPSSQFNLVEWARPALSDKRRLQEIIDPRLENDYPSKGASKASKLILSCLKPDPKNRPSMEEVLFSLKQISAIQTKS